MRVPFTVADFLDRAALVYGERIAIVDEPDVAGSLGRITYASMAARARRMGNVLADWGVGPGDRVGIVSPNSGRFMVSFWGTSGYGRVLVPINYRLTADEIGYIAGHAGVKVLLCDPEQADQLKGVDVERFVVLDGQQDAELFAEADDDEAGQTWDADEDATASINYTSGTTARPKGVQMTHRNIWVNATTYGWHAGVNDRDVYIHTLPMFHCNGWGMPYAVTGMGGRHVVQRKIDGETILRRVEAEEITFMCGAPAVVAAILDAAGARRERGEEIPGAGRMRMFIAGAPPPTKTIQRVGDELHWEFNQIYGLTETSPLLTINRRRQEWDDLGSEELAQHLSRAGAPAVGVQIRTDAEGEILARSNVVFEGYWEQPEETAKAQRDGWFHTGDGGYMDGAYLVISDRKKDVIISGGENVSSIDVEDVLFQHPAVAEAAVIGVPDEKWGETIMALVVLREGQEATERELIDFCRDRLAHFKCPTSIDFREELQRTATGKLQKFKLRAPFWEGRERQVG